MSVDPMPVESEERSAAELAADEASDSSIMRYIVYLGVGTFALALIIAILANIIS